MLKTLIKKQFTESFRNYFVNYKTGKARSKGGIAGMFILFGAIMLYLCGVFTFLAFSLAQVFCPIGYSWLYLAIMSGLSILLGTFGSVFNTYSALYLSKDNDLLLSMPIPPYDILISRIVLVYGLSFLYCTTVFAPTVIIYFVFASPSILSIIFSLLLTLVIPLFVTVITCALGWVVAMIASKLKNKSFAVVFISLALFGLYYFVYFRAANSFKNIAENILIYADAVKSYGFLFYTLGRAGCGEIVPMLIFTGVTAVLFALCVFILSRNFSKIVTRSSGVEATKRKKSASRAGSPQKALLKKEFKRFISSPLYLLNCGLGTIMLPIVAVIALFKRADMTSALAALPEGSPDIAALLPLAAAGIICLILSMNDIAAPSVSLEGKSLWIIKSLPVRSYDLLLAKEHVQLLVNIPTALVSVVIFAFFLRADLLTMLLVALVAIGDIWLMAAAGLLVGIKTADLSWTNETVPIKQNIGVLISLCIGWAIPLVLAGLYFALSFFISPEVFLAIASVILFAIAAMLQRLIKTKGSAMFDLL